VRRLACDGRDGHGQQHRELRRAVHSRTSLACVPKDLRGVIRSDASVATNCLLLLGMARHALEVFIELAKTRGINQLGHARMGDAPVVQSAVAAAMINVKMIESYQQWALST
jgi:alkylation response protein AidB-like acyl-CoA dehydrogenase